MADLAKQDNQRAAQARLSYLRELWATEKRRGDEADPEILSHLESEAAKAKQHLESIK